MRYEMPEILVLGRADVLVLGTEICGLNDAPFHLTRPDAGLALGLDD